MSSELWTKTALYSAPAAEPLAFSDMQSQCRIDTTDEQTLVESYIKAARVKVEDVTGRKLITQTWDVYYDGFNDPLLLPFAPIGTVTSVKYQDTNNTQQTLAAATYETGERNGRPIIRLKYDEDWPTTLGHSDDVVVRVSFGYGLAGSSVPAPILQVLRWYAGEMYMDREEPAKAELAKLLFSYTLTEF